MKKITNQFIQRQSRSWLWRRCREYDHVDGTRAWKIYDKYHDHLIGVIWESEFK